jgi:hypothetical protein
MSRQACYGNVVNWAKKIRNGPGKSNTGSAGRRIKVIRPPGQVAFAGFAVWQCAKGAFVIHSTATNGGLIFGNPRRHAHIARHSDFAAAWQCALKIGTYGLVIYAAPDGTVFIVG